jgi:hypothetical protein
MGGFGGSRPAPPPPPPPPPAPEPAPVEASDEARRRAAAARSRRAGRPLLGPGGAQRDDELQTTLGAG